MKFLESTSVCGKRQEKLGCKMKNNSSKVLRYCLTLALATFCLISYLHMSFGYYFEGQGGFSIGNDDAFITFRYAMNFIEDGILSFNVGDNPPVEGFSNPLYLVLSMIVYYFVGATYLYFSMAILGIIAIGTSILIIFKFTSRRLGERSAIILAFTLSLCPTLWIHASSGLESAFVFLVQAALWIGAAEYSESPTRRQFLIVVSLSIVSVMLRTDGFMFPTFIAIWLFLCGNRSLASIILSAIIFTFFSIMFARLIYYDLPMPLTYYVKVSGDLLARLEVAARYLASISLKNGLGVPLLATLFAMSLYLRQFIGTKYQKFVAPPMEVLLVGFVILYYFYVGGDIYRDRFLMIVFPLAIYAMLNIATTYQSNFLILSLGFATIALQLTSFVFDNRLVYSFEKPKYDRWIVLGEFLAHAHPEELLAVDAAGKIPFFSRLETIDMLGLNDRHISMIETESFIPGHNKYDVDYVMARNPSVICAHLFGHGDLAYGLNKQTYEAAGYNLRYIVRSRGYEGKEIIDLYSISDFNLTELIGAGYSYGCLHTES